MDARIFAASLLVGAVYLTGFSETQNASHVNETSGNETRGNNSIHPYDKFHTIEIIRAQLLKKITYNTVCTPRKPAVAEEITVTDMTKGSRVGPENTNFEFTRVRSGATFEGESGIETVDVSFPNECLAKCTSNVKCLAYAYEDATKTCKMTHRCNPRLKAEVDANVFTLSYWYRM